MISEYKIRDANIGDIDFLIKATIEAVKVNRNISQYSKVFNISEEDLEVVLRKIFLENVEGFELCVKSFLIAYINNEPIGAYGWWIEGLKGMPSHLLRISAFKSFLPMEHIIYFKSIAPIINQVAIKRDLHTLQFESIYVREKYRGKGVVASLVNSILEKAKSTYPMIKKAQVQLFRENEASFHSHLKLGFHIIEEKISDDPLVKEYIGGKTRVKMEKKIF